MNSVRIVTIVGNRPQFVKAAAVSRLLREAHEELLVHTGQHYDDDLSRVFFEELGIPSPDRELGAGSGSNTEQTARILGALEPVLNELRPALVLVYGDTNSTLAGALAAAQAGIPVAHVEAGMRSYDRSMPEELNRVLTDHASDLLLCSSDAPAEILRGERVAGSVEVVGDVMVDVAALLGPRAAALTKVLERLGVEPGGYALATAHRAGNVDAAERLELLVELFEAIALPVVLPLHPRTGARLDAACLRDRLERSGVLLTPPLGYLDADAALAALDRRPPDERPPLYGDGRAGERVVAALARRLGVPVAFGR